MRTFICKVVPSNVPDFPTTLEMQLIFPISLEVRVLVNRNKFFCSISSTVTLCPHKNLHRSYFWPFYSPPAVVELINIEYSVNYDIYNFVFFALTAGRSHVINQTWAWSLRTFFLRRWSNFSWCTDVYLSDVDLSEFQYCESYNHWWSTDLIGNVY